MEADRHQGRAGVLAQKSRQLEIFANSSPADKPTENPEVAKRVASYLSSRCRRPVRVVFTDNTSTMITVKRESDYTVRLHHMFSGASSGVLNALAVYLKWPRHRASNAKLSRYIKANSSLIKPGSRRARELTTRGEHFDLKAVYEKLNARYFDGEVTDEITWGRPLRGRRRRSIRFGCVDHEAGVIRINHSLDAPFVPEFFLEYIVYHEMLHCLVETRLSQGGRTLSHHSDFKRRERQFEHYRDAVKWQNENLHRFLGKRGR